jgi:tetratricopeptide (TPR) repeat protein
VTRAVVATIALVLATVAPVRAQPASDDHKQAAAAHYAEGQRHFAAGEWLRAAGEFEAAYASDPDPVYLYNTAQAYRRGSACARAAESYRRFLAAVPNPPNLDKVHRYLAELDACAKVESVPTNAEPQPAMVEPTAAPAKPAVTIDPTAGRGRRRLGIAIGLGGVALLGVGALFTHDVQTLEGYRRAICAGVMPGATCAWDATKQARATDLQHRGDRATALELSSYALGGAAVVGGIVIYLLGDRVPRERLAAMPITGGGMVVTRFTF